VFQLKAFALQMLHNNVDISASGLFYRRQGSAVFGELSKVFGFV
jgi:hypothetical protein